MKGLTATMSSAWFQADTKSCRDIWCLFKDYLVTFSLPPSSPHLHTLHTHSPSSPIIPTPEVLRHHYETTIRRKELLPYLAIIHVRDMLIPPSERSGFSCFRSGAPLHSGGCSSVVWSRSIAPRVHWQLSTPLVARSSPVQSGLTVWHQAHQQYCKTGFDCES